MRAAKKSSQTLAIVLMAIFNLGLLGVFKYAMLAMNTVNWAFRLNLPVPEIALPIGISFFTFQAMSYVIDVKRGNGKVQKSLLNVGLYITFFPQLIAGPIVRYQTIADEIDGRKETFDDFIVGARRFLIGLCKKILLANNLAIAVDYAFSPRAGRPFGDDGLARSAGIPDSGVLRFFGLFGHGHRPGPDVWLPLPRKLRSPGVEPIGDGGSGAGGTSPSPHGSGTTFTSRWAACRGEVQGPDSCSTCAWYGSLTGLWHGADWKFLLWGFGAVPHPRGRAAHRGVQVAFEPQDRLVLRVSLRWRLLTVLVPGDQHLGRGESSTRAMFGFSGAGFWNDATTVVFREYGLFMVASFICSLPLYDIFRKNFRMPDGAVRIAGGVLLIGLTLVAVTYVATNNYNPFIYFNF